MVALVVISVALAGTLGTIMMSSKLSRTDGETVIASQAARTAIEGLQAAEFHDLFRLYNTDPGDDPLGLGTAPGANFGVPGLDPRSEDVDGNVGRILFPVSLGSPGVLREDHVDRTFGMPGT